MPRSRFLSALVPLALFAGGCSTSSSLPFRAGPPPEPLSSRVWAGHGRAFAWEKGAWAPAPAFDYDFLVLEKRFADRREAVKEIHRRDPAYNGLAGRRDQTLFFTVRPASGTAFTVESSLGRGTGREDGNGGTVFVMRSSQGGLFVPFDHVRITQHPPAAGGRVTETVELYAKRKDGEKPFMRIEEEGTVYLPSP